VTQTQDAPVAVDASRTRTYSWQDPMTTAAGVGRMSGMEMLRAIERGELPAPPITHTLGFVNLRVLGEGSAVFTMQAEEFHYNPIGSVHGGVIATLLDSAAGCAVHSTLPAGWGYTSLDLTTKFLRPVTVESGVLRCEGTVINRGRTTALAEARLFDVKDRLVAYASSTCLLFPLPS
jgi:uncharacterized protein (TIGR00369 family)